MSSNPYNTSSYQNYGYDDLPGNSKDEFTPLEVNPALYSSQIPPTATAPTFSQNELTSSTSDPVWNIPNASDPPKDVLQLEQLVKVEIEDINLNLFDC
jgi:hypothetical protein